ncbi:hypothetical protein [Halalkalicoccus tibetensis]|uniref:DUF8159 domain-containing protein n=1 Tax=Halalkalicoccus tibetensis TaxID=175632 RepID=A0ABD5V2S4_9EURY
MERRKVLLGSGTAIATILAGCASEGDEEGEEEETELDPDNGENGDEPEEPEDEEEPEEPDEEDEEDEDEEQEEIPGFDRENFEIDSDVIEVKELTYRKQKLEVRLMLSTTDRDELVEELEALGPAFEDAIRDADADEFFAEVEELQFTLLDEDKNTRISIFVDIGWLRQFVDDDITSDEFIDEMLDEMAEFLDEMDQD